MCQSSTSSTTSGPLHHDRARNCAVVRSGGGNRFFKLIASALMASSSVALLRLTAPASAGGFRGTASSSPERKSASMNRTCVGPLRAQIACATACAMRVLPDFGAPKINRCGVMCMGL